MEETENVEPIPKSEDSPSSQGKTCALCGCSTPAVRCDRCSSQIFCLSCDDMYHKHPKRRLHLRKAVDSIWNSSRSPRLRRRTDLPGDPSKIPIPPPRTKKRERHSISGRIFLKSGLELGSFGHSKVFDMKSITPTPKEFFAGQKSHSVEIENGIDRRTQLLNKPESTQIYENDGATNQETVSNSNEMERSPWNSPRPNIASPIQISIPSSSPDMTNGQSFGFPSKPHHSQSAADLTGSSANPIGHHPYPFPHPYPYMHPPMHAPYSHSMAHMNCAQCISSSWSNLMSPHPSPFFHPMPWGSAQSTMVRNQQGVNGHMKHSHGDLVTYPDSNFHYPYPGGAFYPNGPPAVDPSFMKDLHQQVEASKMKKSPAGSRHSHEDVGSEVSVNKVPSLEASNVPSPTPAPQEVQITDEEAPKPEKPTEPWSCTHCTFINPPGIYICQVCCKTSYGNEPKPSGDQENDTMDTRDSDSPLINRDAFLNSPRFSPEAQKDDELQDSNIDAEESEVFEEEESEQPVDSTDIIKLTTETQTLTTTKSTDVQTHNLICKSIASSTDSLFPRQEMSVQTELGMIAQNCSVATDPMISSQSMESLLSGVSAPPYHNRRAGWGRGATSFSTQSLYERGRSRSPMPRSASVMNEAHLFGRDSSLPPEEVMPNWSQAWLLSDPMYYKPHNLHGLGQTAPKDSDFDGTWGSMDRLNKRGKPKQEKSKLESYSKFHRSLDDLKSDKKHEAVHSQELMLLQTVKEAERCGFSLEDLHVAYLHCGNQNAVYWLEDNWSSMVKNVIALAAKYGEDNEENDVGTITASEAKEALRIHRGDIWDAVTECIENRQRKILELTVRGNFTQKQIAEALKNNEGNVELAYADLVRASSKRHKFILSPGLSEDSEDLNLYNPTEDSGFDHTIASSVYKVGKSDGLTESKTEKKKSDFLTKLSAIRNAQSERRKAREEKELIRESITQELPVSEESEISVPKNEEEDSSKSPKETIKLVHQESTEESINIDASDIPQVEVEPSEEVDQSIELKEESKNEDNARLDYDTNWVDSQGEWIEEYSDEQWDEEGDGQWVTLEKKYQKLEVEIEQEAMQMAALWEKEELEDEVFEEEKESTVVPTENEKLKISQDEKFEQWVKINLDKSFSEPEDEQVKGQELDIEAMAETLLKDSIEYDDIPASSALQHYRTAFDLTDKSQLESDWVNMSADTNQVVEYSTIGATDECLESVNEDGTLQNILNEPDYSDGEWEKIDVDEQLKELSFDNITLDRKESPEEQLWISSEKFDETEFIDADLRKTTKGTLIKDSAVSLHDYVEVLSNDERGIKSITELEREVISSNISEIISLSPEKEINVEPTAQQPVEGRLRNDNQPKPPVRRKSKLNSAAIEQALKIHPSIDSSLSSEKPPALPAKTKSKEISPDSFHHFAVPQKTVITGKLDELRQDLPAMAPRNVSPTEAPEKPPRLSPTALYVNSESNEKTDLNLKSSKDASPATSMGEESDSNCFADSESDPEIKAIRQKYMHKKLTKYEDEIDDMQEEMYPIVKPANINDTAEVSKKLNVVQSSPINIELTIPPEDLRFSPELPIPIGVRGTRVTQIDDIEMPKAFREDTNRPLQLFKATKREITRSSSYEVPTSVPSEKFQRNRSFEIDRHMDYANESISYDNQYFHNQHDSKPFSSSPPEIKKELKNEMAVEEPLELVNTQQTEISVYQNHFNDVYYNDNVPKQIISVEQLQEGLRIAEVQPDSMPGQKAILPDIQEEKQSAEDFPPKSAQENEEILPTEMGIMSAAADYFFGRYDEVTVSRPKKKTSVIRTGKPATPGSKLMSTSVTQTASPAEIPSRMEQSAAAVTTEKPVTDVAKPDIQNDIIMPESLVKSNASATIKESTKKSPGVETVVATEPQVTPQQPITTEYLSFAEDYFFGSYNEVVVPKKGKKKSSPLQKSKLPTSPQLSRVQSLQEQAVSSVPVSLTTSAGASIQLPAGVFSSVQSDASSVHPAFVQPQENQTPTAEKFSELGNVGEYALEQSFQPTADSPSGDNFAAENNAEMKVVHFEEPQVPVVPPPRKNRAQGDKTQITNISTEHSSAEEYLFGQYDHSLQDKKKLPFHSEDFKMISGFVSPDSPFETLPQLDGIENSVQSSEINVVHPEESIKHQEKVLNDVNFEKNEFGEHLISRRYEVAEMLSDNTFEPQKRFNDFEVKYNDEKTFPPQEILNLNVKTSLSTDRQLVNPGDELHENRQDSVIGLYETEKSDHEIPCIDEEKMLSYDDFKEDLVLAIEKEYESQQNPVIEEARNELSEVSVLFQTGEKFSSSFGNELKFKSQKNNIEQDHTDDSEQEWKLNEERKNCVNAAHLERAVSNKSAVDKYVYDSEKDGFLSDDNSGAAQIHSSTTHLTESHDQNDDDSRDLAIVSEGGSSKAADTQWSDQYISTVDALSNQNIEPFSTKDTKGSLSFENMSTSSEALINKANELKESNEMIASFDSAISEEIGEKRIEEASSSEKETDIERETSTKPLAEEHLNEILKSEGMETMPHISNINEGAFSAQNVVYPLRVLSEMVVNKSEFISLEQISSSIQPYSVVESDNETDFLNSSLEDNGLVMNQALQMLSDVDIDLTKEDSDDSLVMSTHSSVCTQIAVSSDVQIKDLETDDSIVNLEVKEQDKSDTCRSDVQTENNRVFVNTLESVDKTKEEEEFPAAFEAETHLSLESLHTSHHFESRKHNGSPLEMKEYDDSQDLNLVLPIINNSQGNSIEVSSSQNSTETFDNSEAEHVSEMINAEEDNCFPIMSHFYDEWFENIQPSSVKTDILSSYATYSYSESSGSCSESDQDLRESSMVSCAESKISESLVKYNTCNDPIFDNSQSIEDDDLCYFENDAPEKNYQDEDIFLSMHDALDETSSQITSSNVLAEESVNASKQNNFTPEAKPAIEKFSTSKSCQTEDSFEEDVFFDSFDDTFTIPSFINLSIKNLSLHEPEKSEMGVQCDLIANKISTIAKDIAEGTSVITAAEFNEAVKSLQSDTLLRSVESAIDASEKALRKTDECGMKDESSCDSFEDSDSDPYIESHSSLDELDADKNIKKCSNLFGFDSDTGFSSGSDSGQAQITATKKKQLDRSNLHTVAERSEFSSIVTKETEKQNDGQLKSISSALSDPSVSSDQSEMQFYVSPEVYEETLSETMIIEGNQSENTAEMVDAKSAKSRSTLEKLEQHTVSVDLSSQSEKLPSPSEKLPTQCEKFPTVFEKPSSVPEDSTTIQEFPSHSKGPSFSDNTKAIAITNTLTESNLMIKDNLQSDSLDFKEALEISSTSAKRTFKEQELVSETRLASTGTKDVKNALPSEENSTKSVTMFLHSTSPSQFSDDVIQRAVTPVAIEKIPTIDNDLTFIDVDDYELGHETDLIGSDELIFTTFPIPSTVEYFYGPLPSSVKIEPREETESFFEAPSELLYFVNEQDSEFESCISSQALNGQPDSVTSELNSESMYESMTWDEESFTDISHSLKIDDDSEVMENITCDQFFDPEVLHVSDSTLTEINEENCNISENTHEDINKKQTEILLEKEEHKHIERVSQIQQIMAESEFEVNESKPEIKSDEITADNIQNMNAVQSTKFYPKLDSEMIVQSSESTTAGQFIIKTTDIPADDFGSTVPPLYKSTTSDAFSKGTPDSSNAGAEAESLQSKSILTAKYQKEIIKPTIDSQTASQQELKEFIEENNNGLSNDSEVGSQLLHSVSPQGNFDESSELKEASISDENLLSKPAVFEHVQAYEQDVSQVCSDMISESISEYSLPVGTSLSEFNSDESILFESVSSNVPVLINKSLEELKKELVDPPGGTEFGFAVSPEIQAPSDIVRYLYYDDSITFSDDYSVETCSENPSSLADIQQLIPESCVYSELTGQLNEPACPVNENLELVVDPNQIRIDTEILSLTTQESLLKHTENSKSTDEWFDADLEKSCSLGYRKKSKEVESLTETKSCTTQEDDSLPRILNIILDPEIKGIPMAKVDSDEVTDISTHFTMTDDSDRFSDIDSDKSLENIDDEFVSDFEAPIYPEVNSSESKEEKNIFEEQLSSEFLLEQIDHVAELSENMKHQHLENIDQVREIPLKDENGNVTVHKMDAQKPTIDVPILDAFGDVEQTPVPMSTSNVFSFPEVATASEGLEEGHHTMNDNLDDFLDAMNKDFSEEAKSIYVMSQEDFIQNDSAAIDLNVFCIHETPLEVESYDKTKNEETPIHLAEVKESSESASIIDSKNICECMPEDQNAVKPKEMIEEKTLFKVCSNDLNDKSEVSVEINAEKHSDSFSEKHVRDENTHVMLAEICAKNKIASEDLPNLRESVSLIESGITKDDMIKNESDEECSSLVEMKSAVSELQENTSKHKCISDTESFHDVSEHKHGKILPEDNVYLQLSDENICDEIQNVSKFTECTDANLPYNIEGTLNKNLQKDEHLISDASEEKIEVHVDIPTNLSTTTNIQDVVSDLTKQVNSQSDSEDIFTDPETNGMFIESSIKERFKTDGKPAKEINTVISENEPSETESKESNFTDAMEELSESTKQAITSIEINPADLNLAEPVCATSDTALEEINHEEFPEIKLELTTDTEFPNVLRTDVSVSNALQETEANNFDLKEQCDIESTKQSGESSAKLKLAISDGDLQPLAKTELSTSTIETSLYESETVSECKNSSNFQFSSDVIPEYAKSNVIIMAEECTKTQLERSTSREEEGKSVNDAVSCLFQSERSDNHQELSESRLENSKQLEDIANIDVHSSPGILLEEDYIDTSEGRCQEISDSSTDSDLDQNVNFGALPVTELISDQIIKVDAFPISELTLDQDIKVNAIATDGLDPDQNVELDMPLIFEQTLDQNVKFDSHSTANLDSDQNVKRNAFSTAQLVLDQNIELNTLTPAELILDQTNLKEVLPSATLDTFPISEWNLDQNIKSDSPPTADLKSDQNTKLYELPIAELTIDQNDVLSTNAAEASPSSVVEFNENFASKAKSSCMIENIESDYSLRKKERDESTQNECFAETETVGLEGTVIQSNRTSFSLEQIDTHSCDSYTDTERTFKDESVAPVEVVLHAEQINAVETTNEKPYVELETKDLKVAIIDPTKMVHSEEQEVGHNGKSGTETMIFPVAAALIHDNISSVAEHVGVGAHDEILCDDAEIVLLKVATEINVSKEESFMGNAENTKVTITQLEDKDSIDVAIDEKNDSYNDNKHSEKNIFSESNKKETTEVQDLSDVDSNELIGDPLCFKDCSQKADDFSEESISQKTVELQIQADAVFNVDSQSTQYYSLSENSDMTLNFTSDDDFTDVASHITLTEDSDKWSEIGDFSLDDNEYDIECHSRDKTPTRSLTEIEDNDLSQDKVEGSVCKSDEISKALKVDKIPNDVREKNSVSACVEAKEVSLKQDSSILCSEFVPHLQESIIQLEDATKTSVHVLSDSEKVVPLSSEEHEIDKTAVPVHAKNTKEDEKHERSESDFVLDTAVIQDNKGKETSPQIPSKETVGTVISKSSELIVGSDDSVKLSDNQNLVTNYLKTERSNSFDSASDQNLQVVAFSTEGTSSKSNEKEEFNSNSKLNFMHDSENVHLPLSAKLEDTVLSNERDITETDDFTDFSSKCLLTEDSEKWSDVESQAEELKSEVDEDFLAAEVSDSDAILSEYLSLASTDAEKTTLSSEIKSFSAKQIPLQECHADIKSLSEQLNEHLSVVESLVSFDTDVAISKLHFPEETTENSSHIEKSEDVDLWMEVDTDYSVSEFEEDIVLPEKDHVHIISKTSTEIKSIKDVHFATIHCLEEIPHTAEISRSSSYTDPEYSDQTSDTCADISLQGMISENSDKSSDIGNDALLDDILYGTAEELGAEPTEKENDWSGKVQNNEKKTVVENIATVEALALDKEIDSSNNVHSMKCSDIEKVDFHEKLETSGKVSINVTDVSPSHESLLIQEKTDSFETSQLLTPSAATCTSDDELTNVTPLDITEDSDKWSDISEGTSVEEIEEDSLSFSLKTGEQNVESLRKSLQVLESDLHILDKDERKINSSLDEHFLKMDFDSCITELPIPRTQSSDSSLKREITLEEEAVFSQEETSAQMRNFKTSEKISESSSRQSEIGKSETKYKDVPTLTSTSDVSESWHDFETDQSNADIESEIVNQTQSSINEFNNAEDVSTPLQDVQSHELHNLPELSNEIMEDLEYYQEHFEENIDEYDIDIENEIEDNFLDNEHYQINEDELIYPLPYDDWIEQSFELKEYGIEASGSELDIHGYGGECYDDEDIQRAIELNISNFEESEKEIVDDNYITESFQTISNDLSPHTRLSGKEHDSWSTADAPSIEEDLSGHDNVLAKIDELLAEDFTYGNLDVYKEEDRVDQEDEECFVERESKDEYESFEEQQSLEQMKISKVDDNLSSTEVQKGQSIQAKRDVHSDNQNSKSFSFKQALEVVSIENTSDYSVLVPEILSLNSEESFKVDPVEQTCLEQQTASIDAVQEVSMSSSTTADPKIELLEHDVETFSLSDKQTVQRPPFQDKNSGVCKTADTADVDFMESRGLLKDAALEDSVRETSNISSTILNSKLELLEQESQILSLPDKQNGQTILSADKHSVEKIADIEENIPLKSEAPVDNLKAAVHDREKATVHDRHETTQSSKLSLVAEGSSAVQESNNSVNIPVTQDTICLENTNKTIEGTDVIKLLAKDTSKTICQSKEETSKISLKKSDPKIPVAKDLSSSEKCETIGKAINLLKSKKKRDEISEDSINKSTTACIPSDVSVESLGNEVVVKSLERGGTLESGLKESSPETSTQKEVITDIPLVKNKQTVDLSLLTKTQREETSESEILSKPDIPVKMKIKTELDKDPSKLKDSESSTSESRSDSFKSLSAQGTDLKPDIPKKMRQRSLDKDTSEQKPSLPHKKARRRVSSDTSCESLSSSVESLSSFESASNKPGSKFCDENVEAPAVPERKSRSPNLSSAVREKGDKSDVSSTSSSSSKRRVSRDTSLDTPTDLSSKRASIDERVLKLQNEGKCPNKEVAFIAAKLIEMQFEEEDALLAARQCSSVYHGIKFLTQLCELCNCRFPINLMTSMVHCTHRACKYCLKAHFTSLIYDRSIFTLLCPICHKPDITDSNIQEYFNHLDIMLRNVLEDRVYDLFQRKLRDEVLTKDPNFHWCSQCSSGFIASPRLKKLYCPDCSAITCALCHQTWELEHEGVHCERFQQWKDMHTPEPPPAGLVKLLTDRGITCPSCGILFPQACAGSMMYKCSHCNFEFCGFCLRPCKRGRDCANEICESQGIHIHHQLNCLFFLRDKDISDLQMLLEEESVSYLTIPPKDQIVKSRCQVREQKHIHGAISEDRCGRDIEPYCAGLCRTHYLEYLAELMRKHKVDVLSIMTTQDLQYMLRKARRGVPEKMKGETEDDYYDKLVKYVSSKLT